MVAQVMVQQVQGSSRSRTTRRDEKQRRLRSVSSWMKGPHLPRDKLVESLQMIVVRLVNRRFNSPPALPDSIPPLQRVTAKASHGGTGEAVLKVGIFAPLVSLREAPGSQNAQAGTEAREN